MTTPNWPDYKTVEMDDWGASKTAISGNPHAHGKILSVNDDGSSECGIWSCTPGERTLTFANDEFCYFLGGRGRYVHESGEVIEIEPDTAAFFPQDWKGVCTVHETIRKVYMIR